MIESFDRDNLRWSRNGQAGGGPPPDLKSAGGEMDECATLLIVDDERGVRESFNMVLGDSYDLLLAENGTVAMEIFRKTSVDLVLLDIRLPDADGLELLGTFKELDSRAEVIMVTAVREIKSAVQAIKKGAYEYIIKPFEVDDVLTIIERALEKRRLVREVAYLRTEIERLQLFEKMVGNDPSMIAVFNMISNVSKSDGTVLIQGESGTGKELVARAIHNRSARCEHPFVVINCAAIPSSLMESEIFGHDRGAFTGATSTVTGKLEIADKGTVFFDDIDTLDVNMQAKLLRVIQEKEFERLGSTKVVKMDVRFLAASNKDLPRLIEKGEFREDLYYRLNVLPIQLPPLRERKSDIPRLLDHFLEQHGKKRGQAPNPVSPEAMNVMTGYNWPGNVRELQNLAERLVTIKGGARIEVDDLTHLCEIEPGVKNVTLKEAVSKFERQYIARTLARFSLNRTKAAEQLGIHRNTLLTKINELGLDK
jgi:two-component system, NtrC family, response regulator AtoC